ncbi:DNA/RNA helicase [Kurthia senegalensis]|uniref:DNA/RNA helicase n=1 Tax=Kurthia senegalensis TaxID=1033740 RepID=UPI000288B08A|nr:DNA/RNA helicase [Kurthia senegalensis]
MLIHLFRDDFTVFDLPVPTMRFLPFYKKQLVASRIPKVLERQLTSWLKDGKPFLLFFPTIELMERTAPLFERIDASITFVYANEPNRKEKVQALRDGKIAGLLTTTILERGITIPNLQVAVLGAESTIFTSNALIQISGRVGRSVENPDGDVVFYHHGITKSMDEAIAEIKRLNGL